MSKWPDDQWKAWMIAAQAGDQRAYGRLLQAITPLVTNYCKKRLFNPDATDDVVQEILLAMHKVRATYNPAHPFVAWMFGIARHKLLDYYRAQKRPINQAQFSLDDEEMKLYETVGGVDANITKSDARKDLSGLFAGLTAVQQKLLWWQKVEGHSVKDVAKELNMTESAVKVNTHRALKKLNEKAAKQT